MTQEEKAKRYDEALEMARDKYPWVRKSKDVLEEIFPELRESEDERIKNFISNELACLRAADEKGTVRYNELTEAIAWFEKQSEQTLDDKVEPKFKVGDWVVSPNGVYWHIDKISNSRYEVTSNTGESSNWNLDTNIYHRFTIKDAKPGDVLYNGINACIFRKKMEDDDAIWVDAYCGINSDGIFNVNDEDECWCLSEDCSPATKEQREQLEKAMADARYTFDFDKKELKKIQQNSAWSEEDEKRLKSCLNVLQAKGIMGVTDTINTKWLKSLKERYTWKPSDEQMEVLLGVKAIMTMPHRNYSQGEIKAIESLYEQLKALKGE